MNWNAHLALCAKDKYRNLAEQMMANKSYTWEKVIKLSKECEGIPYTGFGLRSPNGTVYVNGKRSAFFAYAQKPVVVMFEETDDCYICHLYSKKCSVLTGEFNPVDLIKKDYILD